MKEFKSIRDIVRFAHSRKVCGAFSFVYNGKGYTCEHPEYYTIFFDRAYLVSQWYKALEAYAG